MARMILRKDARTIFDYRSPSTTHASALLTCLTPPSFPPFTFSSRATDLMPFPDAAMFLMPFYHCLLYFVFHHLFVTLSLFVRLPLLIARLLIAITRFAS